MENRLLGERTEWQKTKSAMEEQLMNLQLQLQATGDSDISYAIGNTYMRYQILKYLLQPTGN